MKPERNFRTKLMAWAITVVLTFGVVVAVVWFFECITKAPTEPPISAATRATGNNLLVIIIVHFSFANV